MAPAKAGWPFTSLYIAPKRPAAWENGDRLELPQFQTQYGDRLQLCPFEIGVILARLPLLGVENRENSDHFFCKLLENKDRTFQKRL